MRKGFEGLQFDGRVAFRQSIINSEIHRVIEQRLTSPKAAITLYAELINWIIENYISEGIYCHTIIISLN